MIAGVGTIDVICGIGNEGISSSARWGCWVRCHCHWNISFRQCVCRFGASSESNPAKGQQTTRLILLQES